MDSLPSNAQLIQDSMRPMEPIPTGVPPSLEHPGEHPIRMVVFDIYGTLLISGSGDIGLTQSQEAGTPFREALECAWMEWPGGLSTEEASQIFRQILLDHQAMRRQQAIEFPEVEIRAVWKEWLKRLNLEATPEQVRVLALAHELRHNPVAPMPDLLKTLEVLVKKGMPLGIVSNAQFYTPILLEYHLGRSLEAAGFLPPCCIWSYQELEGKPSIRLFEKGATAIRSTTGLEPRNCLFVGNDMLNDVWAASQAGFQTALFAGDQRSLRLRQNDPRCPSLIPDVTLTGLDQIPDLIHL